MFNQIKSFKKVKKKFNKKYKELFKNGKMENNVLKVENRVLRDFERTLSLQPCNGFCLLLILFLNQLCCIYKI